MYADNIAFAVLWGILVIAVWNEDIWKQIALLVLAFISSFAYGAFHYAEGYDNGYDRGQCSVVERLNHITIQWEGCDE